MLGFIARCDNTGQGEESVEFVRHLMPDKTLVALAKLFSDVPERMAVCPEVAFLDRFPTEQEAEGFLNGLDTLFCIETPYDWSLLERAQKKHVRTVLRINYEYLPDPMTSWPDILIAPIDWYQPPGTIILPFPVNRERFPFRKRTHAHTFIHIAGHVGLFGRNGTNEVLQAIPLVKSDVKFIIYSQKKLNRIDDPRVEWRINDVADNSVLYQEGDVMVFPRRYGGQALPLNEALSVGMPVMMTDMRPQNAFLPRELLIPYQNLEEKVCLDRPIECAVVEPACIAERIDELANRDISALSEWANSYAESISWKTLLPRYLEILRPDTRSGSPD